MSLLNTPLPVPHMVVLHGRIISLRFAFIFCLPNHEQLVSVETVLSQSLECLAGGAR